jgi:hypothetical protein
MSEPLSSGTKGPQAMSRQKLIVAVGLLIGHKTLTAHMFKLGLTQAGLPAVQGRKEDSVHIVRMSLSGSVMQKIQKLGSGVA